MIRNYNTNNNSDSWGELFYDDNKFPEKSDIHTKFLELVKDCMINSNLINKKVESREKGEIEFYKIQYNLIMDCRRVIDYVLNDKPLYLIKEQVRTFRRFADLLSKPSEERRCYVK